jgi:hypothetical protein
MDIENSEIINTEDDLLEGKRHNPKLEILDELLRMLGANISQLDDILGLNIKQETLKNKKVVNHYYNMIPKLKKCYNSDMLNCLHKNSLEKQKFPAVNMLRQTLKCNNIKMNPLVVCKGYDKTSGKKIVERSYIFKQI